MTPKEKFDLALKKSLGDPYDNLMSFSIDVNGVTHLNLHADLLRDEPMFADLLTALRTDLPTHSLCVSLQPHEKYSVKERFTRLKGSLQDVEIVQVPYQEKWSSWKTYAIKGGIIVVVVVAAPHLVPLGMGALGFGPGGIALNSAAAAFMSSYGGTVASGSLCAIAQSIGAAGLSTAGNIIVSTMSGIATGAGLKVFSKNPKPCL